MKIGLISLHFAEYAWHLAKALAGDHEVLLILGRENACAELNGMLTRYEHDQIKTVLLSHRELKNINWYKNPCSIIREISDFSPDVIHLQETLHDYLIPTILAFRKYKLVLTVHDHIPHSGKDARFRLRPRFCRWLFRSTCSAVIVHGEQIKMEVSMMLPRIAYNIYAIPHGPLGHTIGTPSFDWEEGAVLFFGRIEKYKGLPYLIEAMLNLWHSGVRVKGIIAGRGSDLEPYRDRILSNPDLFELHEGFIPFEQVQTLMTRANMLVLPYVDATQSGIAAMALTYGRPIIASQVGALPEVVENGINGLLVPPKNASLLADAIKALVMNQKLCLTMGKNALRLVETKFSWDNIATSTVKVYKTVLTESVLP